MLKFLWSFLKKSLSSFWMMLLGVLLCIGVAISFYISSLPELKVWHTTTLENEFHLDSAIKNFDDYKKLEERLFAELKQKVIDTLPQSQQNPINRYTQNSLSDPGRWKQNWNRSFEMPVDDPEMAVLLIHGMSDSPYSLHTQAEYLHKKGVYVLGIRLPGHGTVPAALIDIRWEDMAAVVKMAMLHLKKKVGNKPIQIMGFSTGATLALHYTFDALKHHDLPLPQKLVFYSPAIGITPMAKFASWQTKVSKILHSDKLLWNSILPEYDPFKYGSFPVNAADQVYRLSKVVQEAFDTLPREKRKYFPPILTFASVVDATVSVPDIISNLYMRLSSKENRVIFFDINHRYTHAMLIKESFSDSIKALRQTESGENYTFELISDFYSSEGKVQRIVDRHTIEDLNISWPMNVYSLSHVALPFVKDDPLYGNLPASEGPGIALGHLSGYGEKMVLQVPPGERLRQRWNPFHVYMKMRVLEFLNLQKL